MSKLHRYDRAFRYVRNIAQPHCESYTQFCLRTDVLVEAINKAKKYDEKETPKKPIYKPDYCGDHYYFCCTCGEIVPLCSNGINQIKYKYCPYCGQKLDWENA